MRDVGCFGHLPNGYGLFPSLIFQGHDPGVAPIGDVDALGTMWSQEQPGFALSPEGSGDCFIDYGYGLTSGTSMMHYERVVGRSPNATHCGCSSVVEHLLAKERVESSNLFIRFCKNSFSSFRYQALYL